jgi:hypothetical protein
VLGLGLGLGLKLGLGLGLGLQEVLHEFSITGHQLIAGTLEV